MYLIIRLFAHYLYYHYLCIYLTVRLSARHNPSISLFIIIYYQFLCIYSAVLLSVLRPPRENEAGAAKIPGARTAAVSGRVVFFPALSREFSVVR